MIGLLWTLQKNLLFESGRNHAPKDGGDLLEQVWAMVQHSASSVSVTEQTRGHTSGGRVHTKKGVPKDIAAVYVRECSAYVFH